MTLIRLIADFVRPIRHPERYRGGVNQSRNHEIAKSRNTVRLPPESLITPVIFVVNQNWRTFDRTDGHRGLARFGSACPLSISSISEGLSVRNKFSVALLVA